MDVRGNLWCWGGNCSGQVGSGEVGGREGVACVAGPLLPVAGCSSHVIIKVRKGSSSTAVGCCACPRNM